MSIPEEQLERWAQPPSSTERDKITDTYAAVKEALEKNLPKDTIVSTYGVDFDYEVYLQGSYANKTNIRFNSDVDVVVQLKTVWGSDISQLDKEQTQLYNQAYSKNNYPFVQFKKDIMKSLQDEFGENKVEWSKKCLKLEPNTARVPADIVPAYTHKVFKWFYTTLPDGHKYVEGIKFLNTETKDVIVNYPKLHKKSLSAKNDATEGEFKETVRIFKNMKTKLVEDGKLDDKKAPSYYIENLVFNTTDACYGGTRTNTVASVLQQWYDDFREGRITGYRCANGQDSLIGEDTWNQADAGQFIIVVGDYFLNENN